MSWDLLNGKCAALAVDIALRSAWSWQDYANTGCLPAFECNLLLGKCKRYNVEIHRRKWTETDYAVWVGNRTRPVDYFDWRDGLPWSTENRQRKWDRKKNKNGIFAANGLDQTNPAKCQCLRYYKHALGVGHCCFEAIREANSSSDAQYRGPQISSQTTCRHPAHPRGTGLRVPRTENRWLLGLRLINTG